MGRGRKTTLPQDKTEYLQSFYGEFLRKQPHFGTFWGDVERGWSLKWPAAVALGFPLLNPAGAAIEEDDRTVEEGLAIAAAELKDRKIIHQWFYNRASKEKRQLNSGPVPSASNGTLQDIMKALGTGRRTRRLQRREIWQKRNGDLINAAIKEAGFDLLMGSSYEGETEDEREQRISKGRSDQAALRSRVVSQLWSEASEEEMAVVEEEFQKQPKPSKKSKKDYQRGIDKVGPLLKNVHKYVERVTGMVGGTVLVGPIPNNGGKIGTQSYCHGVTPAGHTLDQAHSGWTDHVIKPLQQFGKKIFDHETRRKRALHAEDDRNSNGAAVTTSIIATPIAAPTLSTPEVPSDTSTTTLLSVQTASVATNSSDAASQALGNLSGGATTLFLPGEDDSGQENDYPPLDFDLGYFPLPADLLSNPERIFAPPPHAGVSPLDPILPSSVLSDSWPAERPGEPISTTIPIVSPATLATQEFTAPPPNSTAPPPDSSAPYTFPSSWPNGREWIFPSSMPSTPSTPTSFSSHPPPAPASAPSDARRPMSFCTRSPGRPPLRHAHTASATNISTAPPPTASTASAVLPPSATPAPTSSTSLAGGPPMPSPAPSPNSPLTAPPPLPTTPSTTVFAAPAPASAPISTTGASPVIAVMTPTHLRSALTADDFPLRKRMTPWSREAAGGAGEDTGAGVEEGAGVDVEEVVEQEAGGAGGGGSGAGEDNGYLLRVDEVKGNIWQIGTVSRQTVKEIRAREKARDDAQAKAASDRDHGIFVFPPPPPGHAPLPTAPAALGHAIPRPEPRVLGARERTSTKRYVPQKKRTMEEVRADAAKKKADKAAEKVAEAARKREEKEKAGGKRKANAENVRPGASKRRCNYRWYEASAPKTGVQWDFAHSVA
ncbi:hypothetical protein R3P38DRAFT_2756299 [Favolaschia claudopus]|uniref:Uncharacterized protein n=1 Tax=Favolaschia claudopus TaxID=2862362 RepID=A0AAW0EE12_9AGAR